MKLTTLFLTLVIVSSCVAQTEVIDTQYYKETANRTLSAIELQYQRDQDIQNSGQQGKALIGLYWQLVEAAGQLKQVWQDNRASKTPAQFEDNAALISNALSSYYDYAFGSYLKAGGLCRGCTAGDHIRLEDEHDARWKQCQEYMTAARASLN
jgi:hypothetical protein